MSTTVEARSDKDAEARGLGLGARGVVRMGYWSIADSQSQIAESRGERLGREEGAANVRPTGERTLPISNGWAGLDMGRPGMGTGLPGAGTHQAWGAFPRFRKVSPFAVARRFFPQISTFFHFRFFAIFEQSAGNRLEPHPTAANRFKLGALAGQVFRLLPLAAVFNLARGGVSLALGWRAA